MLSADRHSENDVSAPVAARIAATAGYAVAVGDALTAAIRLTEAERGPESAAMLRAVASMVDRLREELDARARLLTHTAEPLDGQIADRLIARMRELRGGPGHDHR